MKTSLIITTINDVNKNLNNFDIKSKKSNWDFIVIGDKKTPKNFKLRYGKYFDLNDQKKNRNEFFKNLPRK